MKSTPQYKREKGHLCATKILHHVSKGIISGKQEGCSENEGTLGISTLAAKMKVRLGIQLLQREWRYAWEFNSCSENEGTLGKSSLAAKIKVRLGAQLHQLQSMDSDGFQELGAASMNQIWNLGWPRWGAVFNCKHKQGLQTTSNCTATHLFREKNTRLLSHTQKKACPVCNATHTSLLASLWLDPQALLYSFHWPGSACGTEHSFQGQGAIVT